MVNISNDVPAPSPEDLAQGSWRLTLDKPPPLGLKLLLFVPVNSTVLSGLVPTPQKTGPPTPIPLDAAVGLQKIIVSSAVGLPLEVDAPLDLITNKKQTHSHGAPLDLSNKLTSFVPVVSIETPAVSIETPAVSIETPVVDIPTPAVRIKTEEVSIETEAVSTKTPQVSITTPAFRTKSHTVIIKRPALHIKSCEVSIKTKGLGPAVKAPAGSIQLATKECWVVLRKWSGKTHDITGDRCSCVNRKTEIQEVR